MPRVLLDARHADHETRIAALEGAGPGSGLVTAGTGLTESPAGTVNISAANVTKLANTSGTNTGDQTTITGNAGTATALSAGADRTKLDAITGTNTGDQTSVTGNAGTATILATGRNINGVSFNGSAAIETGWSLARKPASPHADDDEFESGSLSAWTVDGGQSGTAIDPYGNFSTAGAWRYSNHSARPSWLMLQPSADAGLIYAIHKPVTVGSSKLMWARISYNTRYTATLAANDHTFGIGLHASSAGAPSANDHVIFYANESDSNEYAIQTSIMIGGVATDKELTMALTVERFNFSYLIMQKISTAFHFWLGTESGQLIYLPTLAQTYTGATLDRAAIRIGNGATTAPGNMVLGVDFIRFSDSAPVAIVPP